MLRFFFVALAASGVVLGPDLNPNQMTSDFWREHGEIYNLPMLDSAGNLCVEQTMFYLANVRLLGDHVASKKMGPLPHVHFRDDYVDTESANRYWDAKFDCPRMTKRIGAATNKINCAGSVLNSMNSGTFNYWTDYNLDTAKHAFEAEAAIDHSQKKSTASHAPADSQGLTWKIGSSGTYEAKIQAYDPGALTSVHMK